MAKEKNLYQSTWTIIGNSSPRVKLSDRPTSWSKGGFAIGDSERAQVICEEHSCVRVFVSIRLKEGVLCNYEEVLNLLQTIQSGSASDGTSLQWGLTINARMEEDVRVLILAGEREEE